ncbi:MAG: Gfo/Idh/MocA family protein, partial [bacterium]
MTLRVGLVGCGYNSDNHLRVYSRTPGVEAVALCDINPLKVEEQARKYGVEKTFTDFESMLSVDLDVIDIVTPVHTHSQLSVTALESGFNVLVEKPMAASAEGCMEMIEAAEESDYTLGVVHNKRYFRTVQRVREI